MMTWASAIVALLKFVNMAMQYLNTAEAKKSGVDEEIARQSVAILSKTQTGREIMAQVMAMTDVQVDESLKGLEPK